MYRLLFHSTVWDPYVVFMDSLPGYCRAGVDVWRTRVPLIYFYIVKQYYPDRVLRQFGGFQSIPDPLANMRALHELDLQSSRVELGSRACQVGERVEWPL